MTKIDELLELEGAELEEIESESQMIDSKKERKAIQSQAEKNKTQYAKEFLSVIVEAEEAIKPFKEHIRDHKKRYQENMWLDKAEQSALISALRMLQKKPYTLDQLREAIDTVKGMEVISQSDEN